MKPLDFVEFKDRWMEEVFAKLDENDKVVIYKDKEEIPYAVGIVQEINSSGGVSVIWIGDKIDKCAWFNQSELVVIDSLPRILSNNIAHPFGNATEQGDKYFGINGDNKEK